VNFKRGVQTDIKEWHGSMDREITYLTTKENYRDWGAFNHSAD